MQNVYITKTVEIYLYSYADDHPISRRRRRKRRHAERRGVAARLKQHATALEEISSTLDDTASPGSKEEEEEEEEGWGVDDSIYHVLCSGFYFHVSPFPSLSCHIVHNPPPPPSLSFVLSCVRSRTERSSKAVKELSPPASPIPSPPPLFFFSPPEGKQSNTLRCCNYNPHTHAHTRTHTQQCPLQLLYCRNCLV